MMQILSNIRNSTPIRMFTVFIVSVLLGFLIIQFTGDQLLQLLYLLLFLPLLCGVGGSLIVKLRNLRSLDNLHTGMLAWFGFWFSLLVRESFRSHMLTTSGCWATACESCLANASCSLNTNATPVPFLFVFIFLLIILIIGLFLVVVSSLTTRGLLKFAGLVRPKPI